MTLTNTSSPVQTTGNTDLPTLHHVRPRRTTAVVATNFIQAVEQSNEDTDDIQDPGQYRNEEIGRQSASPRGGRGRGRTPTRTGQRRIGRQSASPRGSRGRGRTPTRTGQRRAQNYEDNNIEEGQTTRQTFVSAGTPSVQIRTRSPVHHNTGLMDIDTASVICLDDTRTDISEIADFIPVALPFAEDSTPTPNSDLKDLLRKHKEDFISSDEENALIVEVRRENVLTDALSYIRVAQDDLNKPLHISFMNEDGVDLGGVRREFWSLFIHQLAHSMLLTGKNGSLTIRPNYMEKKKNTFFYLGQLTALSILEDGPGLPLFAESVTDYILEGDIKTININDLPDVLREKISEMENGTPDNIRNCYKEILDQRIDVGYLVPENKFSHELIPSLKSAFVEHMVSSCKEELDQFIKGLQTHQVLDLLRVEGNRKKARGLFSGNVKALTAMSLRRLLKIRYSEGNNRLAEMATAQGFLTFIQAASSKKDSKTCVNGIVVTLEDILMWLTGARRIPASGFHKNVDVEFKEAICVNTCALCLTLKINDKLTPEEAVQYYTELLINSQTFTLQ